MAYTNNEVDYTEVLKCTYNQSEDGSFNLWDTSSLPLVKKD